MFIIILYICCTDKIHCTQQCAPNVSMDVRIKHVMRGETASNFLKTFDDF